MSSFRFGYSASDMSCIKIYFKCHTQKLKLSLSLKQTFSSACLKPSPLTVRIYVAEFACRPRRHRDHEKLQPPKEHSSLAVFHPRPFPPIASRRLERSTDPTTCPWRFQTSATDENGSAGNGRLPKDPGGKQVREIGKSPPVPGFAWAREGWRGLPTVNTGDSVSALSLLQPVLPGAV